METQELVCEVCNLEPAVGVACVPAIPYSAAYGLECLRRRANPYWILRANVACMGGTAEVADWFLDGLTFVKGEYLTLREAIARDPLTQEELKDL